MAAPAKFLFDMDFSAPDKGRERQATPSEIAQRIASAEARAYRDGYEAGQREAKAESDRRTALALEEIAIALQGIAASFSGVAARMETEAVDVAVAVARKLCGELISREPLGEIGGEHAVRGTRVDQHADPLFSRPGELRVDDHVPHSTSKLAKTRSDGHASEAVERVGIVLA